MPWNVYLARCRDGSLYTGVTTDPERRLAQHNAGRGGAYTRSRLPLTMVYCEQALDRSGALRRERAIKRLSRAQKEQLVASAGEANSAGGEPAAPARRRAGPAKPAAPSR